MHGQKRPSDQKEEKTADEIIRKRPIKKSKKSEQTTKKKKDTEGKNNVQQRLKNLHIFSVYK